MPRFVVLVEHEIPEVGALPGDYLTIRPDSHPSIILTREIPLEPGVLYGWLLNNGSAISPLDASASDQTVRLSSRGLPSTSALTREPIPGPLRRVK